MFEELGRFGVFGMIQQLRPEQAKTLEELGYGALWMGGSPRGDLRKIEDLLDATSTITVVTGVVNIWQDDPGTLAASYHRIAARHGDRFLLGVGVSSPEMVGARWAKPYSAMVAYLDALDQGGVPVNRRLLAALRPRVLELSSQRSLGAHPYLVSPEHTRRAREIVGPGALLAPEQKVVLESDPRAARAIARAFLERYLGLTNYITNLGSLGYTDQDLGNGGSDELIDVLARHGDLPTIVRGLTAHLDAGADHVAVQVLPGPGDDYMAGLTTLAPALFPRSPDARDE
jgi:probable F420-dependent oxidoreductase